MGTVHESTRSSVSGSLKTVSLDTSSMSDCCLTVQRLTRSIARDGHAHGLHAASDLQLLAEEGEEARSTLKS
eukprot:m.153826 g.153826  ORF g.153826 m.153826 type:complete len:72 (+) comp23471_c0_seq3:338-553(+)